MQWQGANLVNLRLLVCRECRDVPQPQLRTRMIPADPIPILNPRPLDTSVEITHSFSDDFSSDFEGGID